MYPAGPLSTNVYYQLSLTVTDTNGYQQMVSTDILPEISQLTLSTIPPGLQTTLDGLPFSGATSLVAGLDYSVSAPSPQSYDGTNYNFVLWSDGGAATHQFLLPATNEALTASYVQPIVNMNFSNGTLTLSWPQWAGSLALYTTTNLSAPSWSPVATKPSNSNGTLSLAVSTTNITQFYRLQWP